MTFEQKHPDTAKVIEERGYQTSCVQYYKDGELTEQWEKNKDGVFKDVSKRALLQEEIRKEKEKLSKQRVVLRLQKF